MTTDTRSTRVIARYLRRLIDGFHRRVSRVEPGHGERACDAQGMQTAAAGRSAELDEEQ